MEKVLIIKTGYSEILDNQSDSRKVSLGDILRTTPLLHIFKNDDVTWVTDEAAFPLLDGAPYIKRLLSLDFKNAMDLLYEDFDIIINLEKNLELCKFAGKINADWKRYGFRYNKKTNSTHAYDRALEVLTVSSDLNAKRENKRTVQELLFEMVGKTWDKEEYIIGYKPKTQEIYDVGLNTQIGQKWPTKSWSKEKWNKLEDLLIKDGFSVTRQDKQNKEVLSNLYSYMEWVNSCRSIVSNDSLGMHIGITFKKYVLGLFGPTHYKEVHFYGRGKAILPDPIPECMPCLKGVCEKGKKSCMENISPEKVYKEIINIRLFNI